MLLFTWIFSGILSIAILFVYCFYEGKEEITINDILYSLVFLLFGCFGLVFAIIFVIFSFINIRKDMLDKVVFKIKRK
jgi:uncharacterized membrane protein YbhN (UPF0104 family)